MGDDEILQLFYHRVEYAISAVEENTAGSAALLRAAS